MAFSKDNKKSMNGDATFDETSSEDEKYYNWKEVALILDRTFMYLFIVMIAVSTIVCLAILASKS